MWGGIGNVPAGAKPTPSHHAYGGAVRCPVISDWVGTVNGSLPGAASFPPIIRALDNSVVVTVRAA
jgi:hypothetical protein